MQIPLVAASQGNLVPANLGGTGDTYLVGGVDVDVVTQTTEIDVLPFEPIDVAVEQLTIDVTAESDEIGVTTQTVVDVGTQETTIDIADCD